jgi:hypothetical protein
MVACEALDDIHIQSGWVRGTTMIISFVAFGIVLTVAFDAVAGCLGPDRVTGEGRFVVISCSCKTTTELIAEEDSRLSQSNLKSHNDLFDPFATRFEKKEKTKIAVLPKGMAGVILTGKYPGRSDDVLTAFFRFPKTDYCNRFTQNRTVQLKMLERCCDCDACEATPCSVGTRNEVVSIADAENE